MGIGQHNIDYDTLEINVSSADQKTFRLFYMRPDNGEYWQSEEIIAGGDENQFKNAIKGFYKSVYNVEPIVTLKYYDNADIEVPSDQASGDITYKYMIETPTALESASVETIMLAPVTTEATIDIIYPEDDHRIGRKRLSSPPITGTFYVSCYNTDGAKYDTNDMDITTVTAESFQQVLETDCSFLAGKISVTELSTTFASRSMGVEFQVSFHGVAGSLSDYELNSGFDPLVGVDVQAHTEVVREYGASLVWHVIPGGYFYTREVEPQVKVDVDNMPALCTGMACNYKYTEGTSEIEKFELDPLTNQLTIEGKDFEKPTKIEMGYLDCQNIVYTADQITCDLSDNLPAGSWFPQVTEEMGRVKLD